MISLRPPATPRQPEGLSVRVTGRPLAVVPAEGAEAEPWQLPATLGEAKAHLRVDASTEDAYITGLIEAATELAERHTRRAIAVQTLEVSYSAVYGEARLPRPEHVRLAAAYRVDDKGDTLLAEGYDFRSRRDGARLTVLPAERYSTGGALVDGLRVTLLAGYAELAGGASDPVAQASYICAPPPSVKHAVLVTVAELYENRAETVVGAAVGRLPRTAEQLLSTFRVFD